VTCDKSREGGHVQRAPNFLASLSLEAIRSVAIAGQKVQTTYGFEDGVDGFQQGAFGERIFGGDFHDAGQDEGHDADVFGIAAASRFKAGGDAGAFVRRALGKCVMAAVMAIQARHVMVQGNAVANLPAEFRDAGSEPGNNAGGFVSKNARGRDSAVLDFFDVGGADAAGGDADEKFERTDAGNRNGFEAEVVHAAIDDGAHGFGDVRHGEVLTQRRQDAKLQRRENRKPRRAGCIPQGTR
jgi:hypothetical protein